MVRRSRTFSKTRFPRVILTQLDLVLRGGRVINPSQGINSVSNVSFNVAKSVHISPAPKSTTSAVVTPGLIDLHTYIYCGGASLGVDPLRLARDGCTTLVDAGSGGPGNSPGFL